MRTVGIVCEDRIFGRGVAAAASLAPGTAVVEVTSPRAGLEDVLRRNLDVVVVDDATMHWHALRDALASDRRPEVVLVTTGDVTASVAAVVAGVAAVVDAREVAAVLPLAVAGAGQGLCVLPRPVLDTLLDERPVVIDVTGADRLSRLTPREREVLEHLMLGEGHQQIARSLDLSVHTVRFHVKQILAKLRVHSGLEAAMIAARAGVRPSSHASRVAG